MTNPFIHKEESRWSFQKKGKQVFNVCKHLLVLAGAAVLMMGSPTEARANPAGGTVAAGSATITNTPSQLQINQTSQNTVIDWNSFNIAKGETTRFYQPNTSAVALNRVVNSAQVSTINGNLLANGHVLVINPNGVLIGPGGNVDTAGFIATSADIANDAFMNGSGPLDFNIAGSANASVVNQGKITVEGEGLAALVAPTVRNDGIIQGTLSKIQLGAADTFGVDLYGDGLISLAVGNGAAPRTLTAENTGFIVASGGKVLMTAAAANNVVDSVINNTGVIQAQSLVDHNGEITLTAAGADVTVAGKLDVSGANGGAIKIGGDTGGQGTLATADNVTVAKGAVIEADGGTDSSNTGNGGNIITWANNTNNSAGAFSARGGANGGDGGTIDVSTAGTVLVDGTYDASAANGAAGTFLLDPTTLRIMSGSGASAADVVYEDTIESESNGGTDVQLKATNSVTMDSLADGTLAGGKGSITLEATGSTGSVAFADTTNTISTTSGNITVSAGSGGIDIGNLAVTATHSGQAGEIKLTTRKGGDISTGNLNINSGAGDTSTIYANSSGALAVNGDVSDVNVDNGAPANHSAATTTLTAKNDVKVTGGVTVSSTDNDQPHIGATSTLKMTSVSGNAAVGGAVSVTSFSKKTTTGGDGATASSAATVTANSGDISITGPVTVSAEGSNNDTNSGLTTKANLKTSSDNLTIGGDVNVTAQSTYTGATSAALTANTTAAANFSTQNNATVGNVNVTANGVIPLGTLIQYLSSNAGYNNAIGYYNVDAHGNPTTGEIIWNGLHNTAADTSSMIGQDKSAIGFFLLPNGANLNPGLSNGESVTFHQVNGVWQAEDPAGNVLHVASGAGNTGPFFTRTALNPDHYLHEKDNPAAAGNENWEDLQNGGDNDYDDGNFNVSSNTNKVSATLNIKTAASGTGVVTFGNLKADADANGTGRSTSLVNVYSAGVLKDNGTSAVSSADDAEVNGPYAGFDVNQKQIKDGDKAQLIISGLHIIDVNATPENKTYGSVDPSLAYTSSFDDPLAAHVSATGYLTGGLSRAPGENVGDYSINQGGLGVVSSASLPQTGRYEINYTGNTLTIGKAVLTVTADDQTMTYGAASLPMLTDTITGYVNGDGGKTGVVSGSAALNTAATAYNGTAGSGSHVGDYAITAGAGSLNAQNYTFSFANGNLKVTPANLVIAANDANMTYGGAAPVLGVSYTGLANGDTPSSLATRPSVTSGTAYTANAGTYNNTLTASGAADSDYNISYTSGALTINPAPVNFLSNVYSPDFQIGPLRRPIISMADRIINYDPSFEPSPVQAGNISLSIGGFGGGDMSFTDSLANVMPAAGGNENGREAKNLNPADLADMTPAAGGNASGAAANNNDFACAAAFLEGVSCSHQ